MRSDWREISRYCQEAVLAGFLTVFTISCGLSSSKTQVTVSINNVEPRRDVNGEIIDAHDGCLQFFDGQFYLYGTAYGKTDGFTNNDFRVYSSPDIQHWTFEGTLLKKRPNAIYFRPYVICNPKTHEYVLWYNWYSNAVQWIGHEGVAISKTPVGPFTIVNPDVHLAHPSPGDSSLFEDDDGTGYLIYTSINEGYTVRVERLAPDYLNSTGESSMALAAGAEAPILFRRNKLYYALCGPRCAFCPQGSDVDVFMAPSPMGPFVEVSNINRDPEADAPTVYAPRTGSVSGPSGNFIIQVTNRSESHLNAPFVRAQETWVAKFPVTKGGDIFIWMADRWQSTPDGIKGHDFQFWSAPLKFDPVAGTIMPIERVTRWDITWLMSR